MDSILKKGVLLVSMTGIMTAFPMVVHAADIDDMQNITAAGSTQILEDCYTSDKTISVKDHLVPEQKGEYSDMAFANVQSFLYIRSEPTTDSEWVGKLYPDYAAKITGPVGEWTKVESGNVTGYVYSRYITVGNEAQKKAEELVQNNDTGNAEDAFTYAESREEEAARLQKEQEEQKAQAAGNGQAAPSALFPYRRSSASYRPYHGRYQSASLRRCGSDGLPYNAWQPRDRGRSYQSCHGRQRADSGARKAAPYGRSCHRQRYHRAGGTYRSRRRPHGPTFYREHRGGCRVATWHKARGGEPA